MINAKDRTVRYNSPSLNMHANRLFRVAPKILRGKGTIIRLT